MRSVAVLCLVAAVVAAGCGGSNDRPDLAASPPPTETESVAPDRTPTTTDETPASARTATASPTPLPRGDRQEITAQAAAAADALRRWDRHVTACVGPDGTGDDAGATCTRAAWDQLFDQMYAVQYELLALLDHVAPGACHEALSSAVDAVHGLLSGATPLKVVWLDDQQKPPNLFDLESIVDVARPAPAQLHEAAARACST